MLDASGAGGDKETAIRAAEGSFGSAMQFAEQDLDPLTRHITRLLTNGDSDMSARGELSRLIGPRADRERLSAIFELATSIVADHARKAESSRRRAPLVDVHSDLVALGAQAPSYNFDPGLLCLEIGTLLCRAHVASEHAHG